METASIPGGEAVTEPQTTPAAVEPTTTEAPQTEQAPAEGDIRSELAAIRERLDQNFPGAEPPADLMSALSGEVPAEEPPQFDGGQPQEQPEEYGPDAQAQMQALDAYVGEQLDTRLQPIIQERRVEQMTALAQRYPDILQPEVLKPVSGIIEDLIQRTGNDDLRFDAKVVELAYRAAKAELADAGAVPAEQAATQGASLETQAGLTQAGSTSPTQDYVQTVYGDRTSRSSVFE